MKITQRILALVCFCLVLLGCEQKDKASLLVGTIAGPETRLMEIAKKVAYEKYGLNIKIVEFQDYATPNVVLNDGRIDANVFQHQPYLDSVIKARHFPLVAVGRTFVYPVGIYSSSVHDLNDVPEHAKVTLPNDPSNNARALLLLQKAGLITLDASKGLSVTQQDITDNPKQLDFIELDAAQLPRTLQDVSLAVINTNNAVAAGLMPSKDALFLEDKNSPYANLIVTRVSEKDDPRIQQLVETLHSQEVMEEAKKLFENQAIPAW